MNKLEKCEYELNILLEDIDVSDYLYSSPVSVYHTTEYYRSGYISNFISISLAIDEDTAYIDGWVTLKINKNLKHSFMFDDRIVLGGYDEENIKDLIDKLSKNMDKIIEIVKPLFD